MKPLSLIYIIKILLGILVAGLCVLLGTLYAVDILTAVALAIIIYWTADRILKRRYIREVEKPSVITRTGIGIFVITWIFFWALLYTSYLYLTGKPLS